MVQGDNAITVTVDTSQAMLYLQNMDAGMSTYLRELLNQIALETRATEQPLIPVDTGKLRESANIFPSGDNIVVGPTATVRGFPYGVAVARGTSPHDIRPRTKGALFWKGATHPVFVVHHPGTKPHPFDEWTMAEMNEKVQPMADELLDQYLAMW